MFRPQLPFNDHVLPTAPPEAFAGSFWGHPEVKPGRQERG